MVVMISDFERFLPTLVVKPQITVGWIQASCLTY
jgi:hypothetical protein